MLDVAGGAEEGGKVRLYAALAIMLVIAAAASFLIVPHGTGIGKCNGMLFASSKYACLTNLALQLGNSSICGTEPAQYSDACYSAVAENTSDVQTCSGVQNATQRAACVLDIATSTLDYAACAGIAEPYASQCTASIAVRLDNASICSGINNLTYGAECASIIGTKEALETGNAQYCGSVSASTDKNATAYVLENITSLGMGSATLSEALSTMLLIPNITITPRDVCYMELAGMTLNSSLCSGVSQGYALSTCEIEASSRSGGASSPANYTAQLAACQSLGQYANACTNSLMLEHAISTRNATLCGELPGSLTDTCYSLLASTYNDTSYCDYITNASVSSQCTQRA